MTINVQLRKDSVTVVPTSLVTGSLEAREEGEDVSVIVHRGATLVVYEDGATAEKVGRLLAAARENLVDADVDGG